MTLPIWMALPPEVHSGLLHSGPGPESLFAASAQWVLLGQVYAETAQDILHILENIQTNSWHGPSSSQCFNAHLPYIAWLESNVALCAVAAAQYEVLAAAFTSALLAMPTLPELALNHTIHAALWATNFLGINTIPLALNEADYARMWLQAATTMATYYDITQSALASLPPQVPAPPLVSLHPASRSLAAEPVTDPNQGFFDHLSHLIHEFFRILTNEPLGSVEQIEQFLAEFQNFFEQLGFNAATSSVLALVLLQLYDFLWYPYYAAYFLPLLLSLTPGLSVLGGAGGLGALGILIVPRTVEIPPEDLALPPPTSPHNLEDDFRPLLTTPPSVSFALHASPTSGTSSTTVSMPSSTAASTPIHTPSSITDTVHIFPWTGPPGEQHGPHSHLPSRSPHSAPLSTSAGEVWNSLPTFSTSLSKRRQARRTRGSRQYRVEFLDDGMKVNSSTPEDSPARTAPEASQRSSDTLGSAGVVVSVPHTQASGYVRRSPSQDVVSIPLLPSSWTETDE